MEIKEFDRFVESQQEPEGDAKTDWAGTRDEWLKDLDSFYLRIEEFLQEYVKAGSISYTFAEIELTEPNLGNYSARKMDIKIGRQHVSLVPFGTLLIACKGRVDAQGSAGRAQILLVDEQARRTADLVKVMVSMEGSRPPLRAQEPITWAWKIVTNQRTFDDLDKESFFKLLIEIANA
jgi:hypothetical protein